MENILLPSKIEYQKGKQPNTGTLIMQPLYKGYGTTIGNALRRVLLSSLPGAAITAVKIKGMQQEFSSLPNVLEDGVEIVLNLKQIRMKVFTDEPVKLTLKVKGDKEVTAKDIKASSDVEIVNPDAHIATLTDKKAELDMEFTVEKGRGYVPTENQDIESMEIGNLAVDSLYSPVINVGYKVENVRVGQITDYDKLTLDVETDGTIDPEEAIQQANQILIDHFNLIKKEEKEDKKEDKKKKNKIL